MSYFERGFLTVHGQQNSNFSLKYFSFPTKKLHNIIVYLFSQNRINHCGIDGVISFMKKLNRRVL